MPDTLDSFEIGVPCPDCRRETRKTIGWLKSHDLLACVGCDRPIDLQDAEVREGIRSAEREIADFMKRLK